MAEATSLDLLSLHARTAFIRAVLERLPQQSSRDVAEQNRLNVINAKLNGENTRIFVGKSLP